MTGSDASDSPTPKPVSQGSVNGQHLLFVTGRLAESSLRETVTSLSQKPGFTFDVAVPGVQVAALLHTELLLRRLEIADQVPVPFLRANQDVRVCVEESPSVSETSPDVSVVVELPAPVPTDVARELLPRRTARLLRDP